MNIDFRGGKVNHSCWDDIDWNKNLSFYNEGYLSEDILQLQYDSCIIDVGWYGGDKGHFTIFVVIDHNWHHPFACIPCKDKDDLMVQLQRAIDVYPDLAKQ